MMHPEIVGSMRMQRADQGGEQGQAKFRRVDGVSYSKYQSTRRQR